MSSRGDTGTGLETLLPTIGDYQVDEKSRRRARTEHVQGWLELPIEFRAAR